MNALEALKFALDQTGYQVSKIFDGLPDSEWGRKCSPAGMSALEVAEHLCECYVAYLASMKGESHKWGTFAIEDKSHSNLIATLNRLRSECVEQLTESGSDEALKGAIEYVVLHDAYHVGQMALIRLAVDPDWDPYSIYHS